MRTAVDIMNNLNWYLKDVYISILHRTAIYTVSRLSLVGNDYYILKMVVTEKCYQKQKSILVYIKIGISRFIPH